MRRCLSWSLSLLLLFSLCLGAGRAAGAKEREFGVITSADVNMRARPNTDSEVVTKFSLSDEVEVLEEKDGWYRVLFNDEVGYVRADYLFVNALGNRVAYVLEDGVKLRGGPSQSSYVVDKLVGGHGVKVKQMVGEWYFVSVDGNSGYVHKQYLMMTKSATGGASSQQMLKLGMQGQEVKRMQKELSRRGFLSSTEVTGSYGSKTRDAVAEFQKAAGSGADGVAGPVTLKAIYDTSNGVKKNVTSRESVKGRVKLINWFDQGQKILYKGARFKIIDVRTGLTFNARRFGGWYHADSEPLTARDTDIFKRIAGGKWTWDRRAVWVVVGSTVMAASINCMPHLPSPTKANNFPGHFCVHLYKSKVHENSKECPRHQAMVQRAYSTGK